MSKVKKPYGVVGFSIHGANEHGCGERIPHCHVVCFGCMLIISLEDEVKIIKGERQIDWPKEQEILEWIRSNQSDFLEEWNKLSSVK